MNIREELDGHLEIITNESEEDDFEDALDLVKKVGAFSKTTLIISIVTVVGCSILINIFANYGEKITIGQVVKLIIVDAVALAIVLLFFHVTCLAAALLWLKFKK